MGKKMKLMRTQHASFVDIADLTAKVSVSQPENCKTRGCYRGECCFQIHCELSLHFTAKVKMVNAVLEAVDMVDIHEPNIDVEALESFLYLT